MKWNRKEKMVFSFRTPNFFGLFGFSCLIFSLYFSQHLVAFAFAPYHGCNSISASSSTWNQRRNNNFNQKEPKSFSSHIVLSSHQNEGEERRQRPLDEGHSLLKKDPKYWEVLARKTFFLSSLFIGILLPVESFLEKKLPSFHHIESVNAARFNDIQRNRGPSKDELKEKVMKKEKSAEEIEEQARLRQERLDNLKKLAAEEEAKKRGDLVTQEAEIDADLRANYYYPTARKRYLPRIKALADEMYANKKVLLEEVNSGQWDKANSFVTGVAENARLPFKLYASSLQGGGLSMTASYIQVLGEESTKISETLDEMKKATNKKDGNKFNTLYITLENSVDRYRKAAKIDTEDGGVGEFPTDTKVGAAFSNNNPTLMKKNLDK